jgi:phosphotransacetylase
MSRHALPTFDQLAQHADSLSEPVTVAVAGAADLTVLKALRQADDRGWIKAILAGRERDIRRVSNECGVSLHDWTLIDADEPAAAAVALVREGRARMLMKGQIATPALLRAMLDPAEGLRTGRVICQVVFMEILSQDRRFLLADTGICIRPTVDQKIDILQTTVAVARNLGVACPHVAMMAATESVTDAMPETHDAAQMQRRSEAGEFANCVVQGPLSFDLAYAAEAAATKKIGGPAAGSADIMLFPDLLSANLTVKAIMYTADCRFGGILGGAGCPVVFMSRADTTATRLNSLVLAIHLTT